ncbi:MAG: T9SS type A sorting domain-containing protein [Ignavibacteria bacterium]|nr:T9SS type A sorting domain-containing protein [Ignavibacteria bacterium]
MTSNNDEACAVQLAIWHFRNGLDVTTGVGEISGTNDAAIKARTLAIIADVIANGGSSTHVSTIAIKEGTQSDQFYIETKDTAGLPIAVSNIQLTITGQGTLSTYTVNTNAGGVSPDVTVINGDNLDVIKPTATLQIPPGISYSGVSGVLQLLVLGRTTTGLRTAQITYGALPVELGSFTASVNNRNVELNWNTSTETNNAGFEVERKLSGSESWQELAFVSGSGFTNTVRNYTYTDRNLSEGTYNYRLKQVDYNGNFEYFNLNSEIEIGTPNSFNISQNYPNPFNPSTKINFEMAKEGNVSIKVFDYTGKEISTLVNGFRSAGYYTIDFNAINLSSGIYFYRMEANNFTKVMKMSLIK